MKLSCLLLSCTIITYQISPLSNLCQIPDKVPKITLLLCRFSVYHLLPLCISLLVLVVAFLAWQNKSCWTSNNLQVKKHPLKVRVGGGPRINSARMRLFFCGVQNGPWISALNSTKVLIFFFVRSKMDQEL